MQSLTVLIAWLVFAGTHLALGLPPMRDRLAARLGERQFVALFSAIAATTLGLLALAVARCAGSGLPGPALGHGALLRVVLGGIAGVGLCLAIVGLMNYMRSPMALFRTRLNPPAGIECISRHPLFVGFAVFAGAHALLASTLASSLHFLGFAALALGGALLQDRKLVQRHGAAYADYLAATSLLPWLALAQGRQHLARNDPVWRRIGLAAAVVVLLLATHSLWSAFNGALLAGSMAVGGLSLSARRWLHARRSTGLPGSRVADREHIA